MATPDNNVYFLYKVDCEPLKALSPACGGPATWDESERSISRIREVFEQRGLRRAIGFMLTPEAARAHASLWRQWAADDVYLGIQPNVPGFRYPRYTLDLGQYDETTQRQIIAEASDDFAQAVGFRPDSYAACCGSKSAVTPRLLYEAGYRQMHSPSPGRYYPNRPDRCTQGVFPYPHWASVNHHLFAGDLPLCVVPNSGELTGARGAAPRDLRAEAPVDEQSRERYRWIIDCHLELSALLDAPVRSIVATTHNTLAAQVENVAYVVDYVLEAAARAGLNVVPSTHPVIRRVLEAASPVNGLADRE